MNKILLSVSFVASLILFSGCSTFTKSESSSLFFVHDRLERNISSSPDSIDNKDRSVFVSNGVDSNPAYQTVYTYQSVGKLKFKCELRSYNVYDESFGNYFKNPVNKEMTFFIGKNPFDDCEKAENYRLMLERKDISQIVITYRINPAHIIKFEVFK